MRRRDDTLDEGVEGVSALEAAALQVFPGTPGAVVPGIDALFDWFDRQGHSAVAPPLVTFLESKSGLLAQIAWAFEPLPASRS